MNKRTKICETCQQSFEIEELPEPFGEVFMRMQRWCPACHSARTAEYEAEQTRLARVERESKWLATCPLIFRDTNIQHAGLHAPFIEAAHAWDPAGPKGLGFMGPSRLGKTRALFIALRRAFDTGRSVAYISHNDFGEAVLAEFRDSEDRRYAAEQTLNRIGSVEVLLLDDLGKAPTSEQRDHKLESLIDARTMRGRPVLWSSNGHGDWLARRLGPDRGEPLVCRLAEFSTVVKA